MTHKKLLIPIFLISALLLSGCGKRKKITENIENSPAPAMQPETEIEELPSDKPSQIITYTVRLSGKTLSLYENDGEKQRKITSIEINPEFYPKEDIKKLEDGITVPYKEVGYEILENFAN